MNNSTGYQPQRPPYPVNPGQQYPGARPPVAAPALNTWGQQQVNQLTSAYPETKLSKSTERFNEYKVPLKFSFSKTPLYINVLLHNDFPQQRPTIRILSNVQHKYLDQNMFFKHDMLDKWGPYSQLLHMVQFIHNEFQRDPPIPIKSDNVVGASVAQPQHSGLNKFEENKMKLPVAQKIELKKPDLSNAIKRLESKDLEELKLINTKNEYLEDFFFDIEEVRQLNNQCKELREDIKRSAERNLQTKKVLEEAYANHEKLYSEYDASKQEYERLKIEEQKVLEKASKGRIIQELDNKLRKIDVDSEGIKKNFYSQKIDLKAFCRSFIDSRKEYHKYLILKDKVKVAE